MDPIFFKSSKEFRQWLKKNHKTQTEVFVGYNKTKTGKPSMSWSESVDQALCFGWIDSVRRSIDDESYTNRFTPRKPGSNWSAINIAKVEELKKQGLMELAGLEAYSKRSDANSGIYSYEKGPLSLSPVFLRIFKRNKAAWKFFELQAPSYKKVITHWVMSAKQEITKQKRLEKLISASEAGKRIL